MKEFLQKLKTWQKWLLGFFIFVLLVNICSDKPTPEELKAQKEAEVNGEIRKKELAEEQKKQDKLYNAYYLAKKMVEGTLKDPDSYEELDHNQHYINKTKKGATIEVILQYTATNSFGGRIKTTQTVLFDDDLNFIDSKTY